MNIKWTVGVDRILLKLSTVQSILIPVGQRRDMKTSKRIVLVSNYKGSSGAQTTGQRHRVKGSISHALEGNWQ